MMAEGVPLPSDSCIYYLLPICMRFLPNREADLERLTKAKAYLERTVRWGLPIRYTPQDLDDIAAIFHKVVDAYHI